MISENQRISAIQSYLRENARRQYESVYFSPFTLFFHPMDAFTNFNYAVPDFPAGGDLSSVLSRLKAEFRKRKRIPRFEFLEGFAPDLPAALQAAGFHEAERQWGMICTPETIKPAASVSGLSITALHPESPAADIRDFIFTQRQGFSPGYPEIPGEAEIRQARLDFLVGGWQAFTARMGDEPASAGSTGRIIDGVTEAAGISTRPIFRRQGIASYLTWHITRRAFEQGARIAYLTAADAAAGRIYERIGYQPFTIMLTYTSD